jgi:hypothetical protein
VLSNGSFEVRMNISDVPLKINWFANPTAIARSLGLAIALPDPEIEDRDYWARFDRHAWREALVGHIDMTAEELRREDLDWARLKSLGEGAEVWFDLEEGIVFKCPAAQAKRIAGVICELAAREDLPLTVEGERAVVATQCIGGGGIPFGEELAEVMRPAGFEWQRNSWTLVP